MDSSASSTSEPAQSIGTWKMIKGKVVQAVEDIKQQKDKDGSVQGKRDSSDVEVDDFADILSNKNDFGLETSSIGNDTDDDSDTASENTSTKSLIRKSLDKIQQKRTKHTPSVTPDKKPSLISRIGRNITNDDSEKSSLDKKLSSSPSSSLLSKFGARKSKNSENGGDDGGENTILTAFLKSRKKENSSEKTPPPKKRSVEVEDGVEIFEDTSISTFSDEPKEKQPQNQSQPVLMPTAKNCGSNNIKQHQSSTGWTEIIYQNQRIILVVLFAISSLLYFDIPPFLLGFLTCLGLVTFVKKACNLTLVSLSPKSNLTLLELTDTNSPVCEIPAVIEHKSLRSYSGWMYETANYDPNTFHMSLLRNAVFIKLDGSLLRISTAGSRIKRTMLHKDSVDTSTIEFIQHRFYNLEDAKIEMSPKKLARKRYYSRKYPILLHILKANVADEKRWVDSKQNSEEESQSTPTKSVENLINTETLKIYLFAIRDREKEDWFRRFISASAGKNCDVDFPAGFLTLLGKKKSNNDTVGGDETHQELDKKNLIETELTMKSDEKTNDEDFGSDFTVVDKSVLKDISDNFQIRSSASRLSADFLSFIGTYQHANNNYLASACSKISPPLMSSNPQFYRSLENKSNVTLSSQSPAGSYSFFKNLQLSRTRTEKKPEQLNKSEVLEDIQEKETVEQEQINDMSITINVGWANILLGRVVYGCINDQKIIENIRDFLQKKLSVLKLPSFMEEVNVAEIQLGEKPPIIQSISSPELDERGIWMDFDVTYEGLVEVTITTKLNLMRLKRQQNQQVPNDGISQPTVTSQSTNATIPVSTSTAAKPRSSAVLYDSEAESSGSSSESESSLSGNQMYMSYDTTNTSAANPEGAVLLNRGTNDSTGGSGGSKRFLRIVDRITASNIFQSATELSYVQSAFKNMSTKIQLKLQLKSLFGRLIINVPPTPSDRVWISFRAPPKIELSAKPTLGSNVVDWNLVTNLIENKLYEEVCKYLVYPNMVDVILPVLGESTYKE